MLQKHQKKFLLKQAEHWEWNSFTNMVINLDALTI